MNTQRRSEDGFLEDLGRRVFAARGRCCMSRKLLAQASGISERYIAQIEGGNGNVLILLLRRLSTAMATPLVDLIGIYSTQRGTGALSCELLTAATRDTDSR